MGARAITMTPLLLTHKAAAFAALVSLALLDGAARALAYLQESGVTLAGSGQVRIETVILITSTIVGLATAYLRLYVGNQTAALKAELVAEFIKFKAEVTALVQTELSKMKAEIVTKEVHSIELRTLERRLDSVEREKGESK